MIQNKKYAVMYLPRSGLFFAGGEFLDGHQNRIPWSRTIPVFRSRSAAAIGRDKLRKHWEGFEGDFVVVSIEFRDENDPEPDAEWLDETEQTDEPR